MLLLVGYRTFEFSDSPEANVTPYLDNRRHLLAPNYGITNTVGKGRVIIPVGTTSLVYKVVLSWVQQLERPGGKCVWGAATDIRMEEKHERLYWPRPTHIISLGVIMTA